MHLQRRILKSVVTFFVLGLLSTVLQPQVCGAQSNTFWAQEKGLRLGLGLNGLGIDAKDTPASGTTDQLYLEEEGGGASFSIGYTFSPLFSLCFAVSGARHDTSVEDVEAYYSTAYIEGHFRFMPQSRVRPYLVAGLGGAALTLDHDDYDSQTTGSALGLGLGMLLNLTDHLLLDAALRLDLISWDEIEFTRQLPGGQEIRLVDPLDEEGGAGRFQLGLTYAF